MFGFFQKKPDLNPDRNMNILDHLEELRYRMLLSIIALIFGFVVGVAFSRATLDFLFRPFSGIELHGDQPIMKIAIGTDGSLRMVNEATSKTLETLSPYRINFYLPDKAALLEQNAAQANDTIQEEGEETATSGTLKTLNDTAPTTGGWVTRYLSKLSFWKKKDRSSEEIKPDFVYGYSLQKPIFFNPVDPVMLWLKTSFFLGLLIALPLILYQVWAFIAPGLMASEKKVIVPILAFACILFPTGATIAYLGFRMVLSFLLTFQIARMEPTINVYSLLGLEIKLMVGFGVAFELPIVIMFLTMLGLVTPARLREWRSYAIVINAIIAAILTPTADPGTMLLMMVPLVILYEISIFASIPIARKRAQADREIEEADEEVRSVEADAYEQLQAPTAPGGDSGAPAPPEGETEPTVSTETTSDDEPVVGPYPGYAETAYPQSYYEPSQTEISSSPENAPAEVYYAEPRDQRQEDRKRWKRKQLRRMRYRPDEEEF